MPAARALSSPSGELAEDNIVEREKFWGGRNYGITLRNYVTEGLRDVEFEVVF